MRVLRESKFKISFLVSILDFLTTTRVTYCDVMYVMLYYYY